MGKTVTDEYGEVVDATMQLCAQWLTKSDCSYVKTPTEVIDGLCCVTSDGSGTPLEIHFNEVGSPTKDDSGELKIRVRSEVGGSNDCASYSLTYGG